MSLHWFSDLTSIRTREEDTEMMRFMFKGHGHSNLEVNKHIAQNKNVCTTNIVYSHQKNNTYLCAHVYMKHKGIVSCKLHFQCHFGGCFVICIPLLTPALQQKRAYKPCYQRVQFVFNKFPAWFLLLTFLLPCAL